jgi:hypothetical protein
MPTVPLYREQTVRQSPLPNARFTTQLGPNASGQNLGQALQGIGARMWQEEKDKADEQALYEARRKLNDWELGAIYDPKNGAISKRGRDAFALPDELTSDYNRVASEIEGSLAGDNQKLAFRKVAEARRMQVMEWTTRHVAAERRNFYEQQYVADMESSAERASMNPDVAPGEIRIQGLRTIDYLSDQGASKEVIQQALQKRESDTHQRVVNRLLARAQDVDAFTYYQTYKERIDPDVQAKIDQAFQQNELHTESRRRQQETEEERRRRKVGDDVLKEALSLQADGKLTRQIADQAKAFISPSEYQGLLKSLMGEPVEDDPAAYAALTSLTYSNPAQAERQAFVFHKNGRIRNSTLSSVVEKAREVGRTEGPRSVFERSRQFITNSLDPGPLSSDPAPKARMGLAVKEFEDYAAGKQRTDGELEIKSQEVVRRYALIDMNDLARSTGLGARSDPQKVLQEIREKGMKALDDLRAGRITQSEYDKRASELKKARDAALKTQGVENGKR